MYLSNDAFRSPIGAKMEEATRRELAVTDWALNLEICDMINSTQDGPQTAIKGVRSRLQQRDDKVIENVLILLDTLIKNCGRRLHLLIAQRDFMCDLIRLVSPRDPTPQPVKDRALTLIERCSDAFAHDKDLSAVGEAYQYLKSQNVQFPAQNLDDMVAIHTPRATHSVIESVVPHSAVPSPLPAETQTPPVSVEALTSLAPTGYTPAAGQQHPAAPTGGYTAAPTGGYTAAPTGYTPQQYPGTQQASPQYHPPGTQQASPQYHPPGTQQASPQYHPSGISRNDLQRLNKELLVVRGNDGVMNDILVDLQSNPSPCPDELLLLRDLHRTCKEMYTRMVALLEQVVEEGLVCQLLDLIDKLNNTFVRYDRYERNLVLSAPADPRTGAPAPIPAQTAAARIPAQTSAAPIPAQTAATPTPAQQQGDAANIYATPHATTRAPHVTARQQTPTQAGAGVPQQRGSDIEELLSLNHPEPVYAEPGQQQQGDAVYAEPTSQHPHEESTNPFQEFVDAPISRLRPVSGNEEDENIYTTSPAKLPVRPAATEDINVILEGNIAGMGVVDRDEFDMFAQSRSSTLSDRVQASGSEVAYEAAHDVPQAGSLADALHNRAPVDASDDRWLHELNTVESTSQAMSNEEFDRFLNERAPAPPTTPLQGRGNRTTTAEDDLMAL